MRLQLLLGVLISARSFAFQFPGNHPTSLTSPALHRFRAHSRGAVISLAAPASSVSDDGDLPVEVRALNEAEGKTMLEWPSVTKNEGFDVRYEPGESVFVLEGSASISCSDFLNGAVKGTFVVNSGELVTVTEPCALRWDLSPGTSELVLLTPSYTEGNLFLGVAASALIAFVGMAVVATQ